MATGNYYFCTRGFPSDKYIISVGETSFNNQNLKGVLLCLDKLHATSYNYSTLQREVIIIADNSRADYFKQRRRSRKSFNVLLERDKAEKFEQRLKEIKKTKAEWLNEKIDEELIK